MNFFVSQEAARRKTRVLLAYYALAVALIVCAVYLASRALFGLASECSGADGRVRVAVDLSAAFPVWAWDSVWFLCAAGATLLVVLGGTLWRRASLAEGGAGVARSAGGREIAANTQQHYERRLLNIVEEVALASGVPVPRVFVLEQERGVNAFAAGFSLDDAAVAVTRGAMEQLTREELQGVVAHEFSHILNGDMRLNSWLIGVLFGILVLSVCGKSLMRLISNVRMSRSSRGGGGAVLVAFLAGAALWLIGSIGVFFARLIQSSVSRQREYLADASAVQFTRNPLGLAGALKRIGALSERSALLCVNREELSHLLFSSGGTLDAAAMFASHPPLLRRIRSLDPSFDGNFAPWRIQTLAFGDLAHTPEQAERRESGLLMGLGGAELLQASGFLQGLPPDLRQAASHPFDAAGILYGLLLCEGAEVRQRQKGRVLALEGQHVVAAAEQWAFRLRGEDRTYRRMIAELAVEGLRQREPAARAICVRLARELIEADGEISLFEYMLERRLARRLEGADGNWAAERPPLRAGQAQIEASLVLGTLAYVGQPDDDFRAQAAWHAGSLQMPAFGLGDLVPVRSTCTLDAFDQAMSKLAGLAPLAKGELIAGCAAAVGADGRRTADETELLRAVSDMLDLPLPPE